MPCFNTRTTTIFALKMVQYFVYLKARIYDVFQVTLRCTFVAVLAAKFSHVSLIVFNHFSFHKMEFIGCKKTNFYNWTIKCFAFKVLLFFRRLHFLECFLKEIVKERFQIRAPKWGRQMQKTRESKLSLPLIRGVPFIHQASFGAMVESKLHFLNLGDCPPPPPYSFSSQNFSCQIFAECITHFF